MPRHTIKCADNWPREHRHVLIDGLQTQPQIVRWCWKAVPSSGFHAPEYWFNLWDLATAICGAKAASNYVRYLRRNNRKQLKACTANMAWYSCTIVDTNTQIIGGSGSGITKDGLALALLTAINAPSSIEDRRARLMRAEQVARLLGDAAEMDLAALMQPPGFASVRPDPPALSRPRRLIQDRDDDDDEPVPELITVQEADAFEQKAHQEFSQHVLKILRTPHPVPAGRSPQWLEQQIVSRFLEPQNNPWERGFSFDAFLSDIETLIK